MPFQPVQPEKLSSAVVQQIELLILRGVVQPGERLPSERELAERLDVSRPSLREAIAMLQEAGLLISKPSAGIFVSDMLNAAFPPALSALFARHEEAVFDYIAFRRDMEGLAAARAARFGSDTDHAVINTIFDKMEASTARQSSKDEARLDAEFHMAIVEAGHNVVMLHMMRSMFELLRAGVFYNRQVMFQQRTTRSALLDQHRAIRDAIIARDPDAARAAVEAHMDFVSQSLRNQRRADHNQSIAQQRLDHARGE